MLQIYQSSFFESESQHIIWFFVAINCCCKYIKVPFLKANHNSETGWYRYQFSCCKYIKVPFLKANHNGLLNNFDIYPVVANISKFLFWKRITTLDSIKFTLLQLLQIYQSSFFESESQHKNTLVGIRISCCRYIKVPFLKANHNRFANFLILPYVVANISKFLFWKRITTWLWSNIAV